MTDAVPAALPASMYPPRSGDPSFRETGSSPAAASKVPIIYTRIVPVQPLRIAFRVFSAVIAAGCLTVLIIAAWLIPASEGTGTHMQLGLQDCAFKVRTGLPCPSCGFTTAFTWFAHGHPAQSFYTQPMGCVLAILTAVAVWAGFYIAITGRPVHRLLRFVPSRYYLMPLLVFALLAWGWKIVLTLKGW